VKSPTASAVEAIRAVFELLDHPTFEATVFPEESMTRAAG
jgi:hypothetical protein